MPGTHEGKAFKDGKDGFLGDAREPIMVTCC